MKPRNMFLIMFGVWIIDFVSTAIVLNLATIPVYESNPIGAWFQSFGVIGWVTDFILTGIIIFGLAYLIDFTTNYIKKEQKYMKPYINLLGVFVFCLMEIYTIINNFKLLW